MDCLTTEKHTKRVNRTHTVNENKSYKKIEVNEGSRYILVKLMLNLSMARRSKCSDIVVQLAIFMLNLEKINMALLSSGAGCVSRAKSMMIM